MRNKSSRKALPYLLALCAVMPNAASAWGFQGHTYIGDLTWQYLSPQARVWVQEMLERVDEKSLGEMVTWADRIRSTPEGRAMGSLHFANVPPEETSFVLERDCPSMRCVVGAAMQSSAIMLDPSSTKFEQAAAFRAFTHWITDLHQPLHLGFYEDKGGNSIRVTYQGKETNLHSLWDTVMLKGNLPDVIQFAAANPLPEAPTDFNLAILEWATTSNELAREYAYKGAEQQGEISSAYIERALPIAHQQLLHSAQRLAFFIEAAAHP